MNWGDPPSTRPYGDGTSIYSPSEGPEKRVIDLAIGIGSLACDPLYLLLS